MAVSEPQRDSIHYEERSARVDSHSDPNKTDCGAARR